MKGGRYEWLAVLVVGLFLLSALLAGLGIGGLAVALAAQDTLKNFFGSLIIMHYWYHPPDWAAYMAFSERVNLQIMRAFEKEGIEFAFPTSTNYLAHDSRRPLHIRISGELQPAGNARVQATT